MKSLPSSPYTPNDRWHNAWLAWKKSMYVNIRMKFPLWKFDKNRKKSKSLLLVQHYSFILQSIQTLCWTASPQKSTHRIFVPNKQQIVGNVGVMQKSMHRKQECIVKHCIALSICSYVFSFDGMDFRLKSFTIHRLIDVIHHIQF